jgi:hypothetical protein
MQSGAMKQKKLFACFVLFIFARIAYQSSASMMFVSIS